MRRSLSAGLGAVAIAATLGLSQTTSAEARPIAGASPEAIAAAAPVAYTRYRGYGYRHGYYRRNHGGAIAAGAALGLIGGIATAAAVNSYGYGGYYPAGYGYGYGYPAYGYAYPAYSYGYGYPYGGYRRAYYPRAYGGGWRRAGWHGGPYGGVRYRSGGWRW
jgi:hypothetical protein